jgi:hypothetical protein
MKKKIGAGAVGLVALGGSVFGLALSSGIASASNSTTTTPPVVTVPGGTTAPVVTVPGDTNAQGDSGANVQSGDQTGSQSTAPDATEGTSSETASSEVTTVESDGVGGPQDVSGSNVDSQTTGAQ